jgi:hypothetical protein
VERRLSTRQWEAMQRRQEQEHPADITSKAHGGFLDAGRLKGIAAMKCLVSIVDPQLSRH